MRQPFSLRCRPAPSTRMPAFAISSWNPPISRSRDSGGILPASESCVAFTRIMNRMGFLLLSPFSRLGGCVFDITSEEDVQGAFRRGLLVHTISKRGQVQARQEVLPRPQEN